MILENESKPRKIAQYDKLVCAEFRDRDMFPELQKIIIQCNIHGPWGSHRNDGNNIQVRGNVLDCRWIVPYNPFLTMWYKAHI